MFQLPLTIDAVAQIIEVKQASVAMSTWFESNAGVLESLKDHKWDFTLAAKSWNDTPSIHHLLHSVVQALWTTELETAIASMKQKLPPSAMLEQSGIYVEGEQLLNLTGMVKVLSDSGLMSTSSKQVAGVAALDKAAFKHELTPLKKELSGLRTAARRAICVEWAATQVQGFIAQGPESMIAFVDNVLEKLKAKGMGATGQGSIPLPGKLADFLAKMKKTGTELAEAKAKDIESIYLLSPPTTTFASMDSTLQLVRVFISASPNSSGRRCLPRDLQKPWLERWRHDRPHQSHHIQAFKLSGLTSHRRTYDFM